MNLFIKSFILLSLLINNSFAMNSQFKASFMKDNKETTFVGNQNDKKTNEETQKNTIMEYDAIFQEFNSTANSVERILNKPENCLIDSNGFENCPSNAIQCNELIEKTNGISTLEKKEIIVNKILKDDKWICPDNYIDLNGFNSQDGLCKKEYSFYKYSCDNSEKNEYNIGWNGPVISTGIDCFGNCGSNGCICNEEKAPENNCFRENYGCPFDIEQKCTKMKDSVDTRTNLFQGEIYQLGTSIKFNKIIKDEKTCSKSFKLENGVCIKKPDNKYSVCPKNSFFNTELNLCVEDGFCPIGFVLKDDSCIKEYSYNTYSCPESYSIKETGLDCLGNCGPNGCSCNSETPPENNCFKKYDLINKEELSYELKREVKINYTKGNFNIEGFNNYYGFSYKDNEIDNISKIYTLEDEPNKICFKANNGDSNCITVDNCSFKGMLYSKKIKEINISDKKIYLDDKNTYIESSCNLNGHVGWKNRIEGITSVKSENNKILFYDSFMDKNLGFIEFINNISEEDIKEGFSLKTNLAFELLKEGFYASDYLNGYTYFSSEELMIPFFCDKLIEKFTEAEKEYKFDNEELRNLLKILTGDNYKYLNEDLNKCIIKVKGDISFNSNKYLFKNENKKEDFTIFKCSPISCNNNMCQQASCPEGYEGLIHTKNETVKDNECQLQSCDANKPYALYCGLSKECDVTEQNILLKDGKCSKAICEKGTFDKEKNKCIENK